MSGKTALFVVLLTLLCGTIVLSEESIRLEPRALRHSEASDDLSERSSSHRVVRQALPANGDLRLMDGSTESKGRLEVYRNGAWGTVCSNGWGTMDASVACSQLGYPTVELALMNVPVGTGTIVMDMVECQGHESRLLNCPHDALNICSHSQDVGIACSSEASASSSNVAVAVAVPLVIAVVVILLIVGVILGGCIVSRRQRKNRAQARAQREANNIQRSSEQEPARRTSSQVQPANEERLRRESQPSAPQAPPSFNPDLTHFYNQSDQMQHSSAAYPLQPQGPPPDQQGLVHSQQQAYPPPTYPPQQELPPPYPVYQN